MLRQSKSGGFQMIMDWAKYIKHCNSPLRVITASEKGLSNSSCYQKRCQSRDCASLYWFLIYLTQNIQNWQGLYCKEDALEVEENDDDGLRVGVAARKSRQVRSGTLVEDNAEAERGAAGAGGWFLWLHSSGQDF
jgi:hypothetical protein